MKDCRFEAETAIGSVFKNLSPGSLIRPLWGTRPWRNQGGLAPAQPRPENLNRSKAPPKKDTPAPTGR